MKRDIYQEVTDRIINLIESGAATGDWMKPWKQAAGEGVPINAVTHRNYHGVNVLMLWATAAFRGYSTNEWASYRQWLSKGAQVQKKPDDWPEREPYGTMIVYANTIEKKDEEAEDGVRRIWLLKHSTVFNADQVDGYEPERIEDDLTEVELDERIEHYIEAVGADVRRQGGSAHYVKPPSDYIAVPAAARFETVEHHYSALFHELTHWTGIKERCDRDLRGRFGDESYAMEELVAELGSAFQSGMFGLEPVAREDHAEYVANWLKALRSDNKAIVTAASKAADAVDWLTERAGAAVAA